MRIDSYTFGNIVINGTPYTSDVIIYPDRVDASWRREEGHSLQIIDLTAILAALPTVLVIGNGHAGVMRVSEAVMKYIRAKGVQVHVGKTLEAVELYNSLPDKTSAVGAFHITC